MDASDPLMFDAWAAMTFTNSRLAVALRLLPDDVGQGLREALTAERESFVALSQELVALVAGAGE